MLADHEKADHVLGKDSDVPVYLFNFPAEMVKEIILGYGITKETRDSILDLRRTLYPNGKLFYTSLHERTFDLKINPYNLR
jgi:hypothetical protein